MSTTSSSRKRPTSSRKTPNRKSYIKSRKNVLQILSSSSDDDDNSKTLRKITVMITVMMKTLTVMLGCESDRNSRSY